MVPTLFTKKSKHSLRSKINIEDIGYPTDFKHTRSMSTTSTCSTSSSTLSHSKPHSYDPLSCHPPLAFNTSPVIQEDDSEEQHDEEQQPSGSDCDDTDSPLEYYFTQDRRRRTYVYEQEQQWPLKDWQTIPPGLVNMSNEQHKRRTVPRTTSSSSTASPRRQPQDFISPMDEFVKRGDWKRRGIVFGLDDAAAEEQTRHFEVNPFDLVV